MIKDDPEMIPSEDQDQVEKVPAGEEEIPEEAWDNFEKLMDKALGIEEEEADQEEDKDAG